MLVNNLKILKGINSNLAAALKPTETMKDNAETAILQKGTRVFRYKL